MKFFSKKNPQESPACQAPTNPYLLARAEWLERYGSYIQQAANWRLGCFGAIGILAMSVAGNIIQGTQAQIVPYVVEVDQLGKAVAVARADEISAMPQRVIQAEIASLIVSWRTVTADTELQNRMIDHVSARITGSAKGTIKSWYNTTNNPFKRVQEERVLVSIAVKGLPLPISKDSWRVEWSEITRNQAGAIMDTSVWEATLTAQIVTPTKDEQIMANPAGLVVTDLSFSKVINQGAPKGQPTAQPQLK